MEKKIKIGWIFSLQLAILWTSCFCASVCVADSTAVKDTVVRLKEAEVAREAAEARSRNAEEALTLTRRQLAMLRARYADLFIESQTQLQEIEQTEMRIGHLLVQREGLKTDELAARAFRTLNEIQQRQQQAVEVAEAFGVYLDSVLDVLQTSDTLRREVKARYDELERSVGQTLKPLPQVAGRGSRDLDGRKCRVFAVNDELQVIVLDRGHNAGIRPGSVWRIEKQDATIAELKVLEVREQISAAMILKGRLDTIAIGDVIVPDKRPLRQVD